LPPWWRRRPSTRLRGPGRAGNARSARPTQDSGDSGAPAPVPVNGAHRPAEEGEVPAFLGPGFRSLWTLATCTMCWLVPLLLEASPIGSDSTSRLGNELLFTALPSEAVDIYTLAMRSAPPAPPASPASPASLPASLPAGLRAAVLRAVRSRCLAGDREAPDVLDPTLWILTWIGLACPAPARTSGATAAMLASRAAILLKQRSPPTSHTANSHVDMPRLFAASLMQDSACNEGFYLVYEVSLESCPPNSRSWFETQPSTAAP